MNDAILIPLSLGVPLLGAILAAVLGPTRGPAVRWTALATTLITLVLVAVYTIKFASAPHPEDAPVGKTFAPQMTTIWNILPLHTSANAPAPAIQFYVGIDGLNVWLVALIAVLMVSSVLVSWTAITERVNEFYAWLLVLQMAMIGVFVSFDIVLFYVFFELTLVPLFFLIGIWGGPQRQHAARKFFVYTLAGSMITLLGVLGVVLVCYHEFKELTFSIPRLVELVQRGLADRGPDQVRFWKVVQLGVFLALMAGFAIKVPLVPFHTWLPLAHVEAPTAGLGLARRGAAEDRRLRLPASVSAAGPRRGFEPRRTADRHAGRCGSHLWSLLRSGSR